MDDTDPDLERLYFVFGGHIFFQTLRTAVQLDLFTLLAKDGPLTRQEIAKKLDIAEQPMRIVGMSERILVIDGEYIHIMPASGGKALHDGSGKTTTVHFSNVVGCKVLRKHPTNVKVRVCCSFDIGLPF